tara:strand:+ start:333 stop:1415 length:1083 start_codon:yes stop_codon:yes gene_type:complete
MSKITVVGASYAGLISALAFWRQGHEVSIVGPKPKSFNRTFSLLHGTVCALKSLLDKDFPEVIYQLSELELNHSERWGALRVKSEDYQLPFILGSIDEGAFLKALIKVINKNTEITWHECFVSEIDLNKSSLSIKDAVIEYDYLIGCDGASSPVRSAASMSPIELDPFTKTSMQIATCNEPIECAYQSFSDRQVSALVPLKQDQAAFYLTTYEPKNHPWGDNKDLSNEITDSIGYLPSTLSKLIQFRSPNHLYPSAKDQVVLMGEAAISMGPVGAQGINGIIADLGVILSQKSISESTTALDSIRSKRYRLNQITQYSTVMHLGILMQGLIPPLSHLVMPSLLYGGAKTSLHFGEHQWER